MFPQGGHRLGGGEGGEGGGYSAAPLMGSETGDVQCNLNGGALICGLNCLIGCGLAALMLVGTVEPLTVGIRYNKFNKAADTNEIYDPGRHIIGPFNKFLIFPASIQTIEFTNENAIRPQGVRLDPLRAQDSSGLPITLHVSIQYKLVKDDIGKLYSEYNMAYETQLVNTIRKQISQASTKFSVGEIWEKREQFGRTMRDMVDSEIRTKCYARCWGVQIWNFEIPLKVDKTLVNRQLQQQMKSINQAIQQANVTRSQTEIYAAQYARKVKVTLAKANAGYTLITKEAQANATQHTIGAEADVMGILKKEIGLLAPELVTYQRYTAMDDLAGANLVYGFGGPQQVLLN